MSHNQEKNIKKESYKNPQLSNEKYFRGSLDISRITNINKNLELTYPGELQSAPNTHKCTLIKDTPLKFGNLNGLGRITKIPEILKLTCPICTPSASCSPSRQKSFEFITPRDDIKNLGGK